MKTFSTWALQVLSFTTPSIQQTLPRTVFQFPNPTWLENIASTRTGHLLTGVLGRAPAELHIVDPFASTASLLHAFPAVNSIFGITEYAPDLFAVAIGNYSTTTGTTAGSFSVWTVDLRPNDPLVTKIADVGGAKVINGAAALDANSILLADSIAGTVIRLDVETGHYETVIEDASTANGAPLGVNGIKVSHATNPPTVYYTNSHLNATFSAPVHPHTGRIVGNVTKLATESVMPDDITVTDDGAVFVAHPYEGLMTRMKAGEEVATVAGAEGSSLLGGATSASLGRTYKDRDIVYVATMGGFAEDGSFVEGGKIVAVELPREGAT